eukprot:5417284-Amphidinium_carterae.1
MKRLGFRCRLRLAHYARACTDIVFNYPFGESELLGVAARGEYDLQQHAQASGEKLDYQVPGHTATIAK